MKTFFRGLLLAIPAALAAALRQQPPTAPKPTAPRVEFTNSHTTASVPRLTTEQPLHYPQRVTQQPGVTPFPAGYFSTSQPSYSYPSYYGPTTTKVSGYNRTNGTSVPPYLRTTADQTNTNNWSHSGNVNPVTGAKGYHK